MTSPELDNALLIDIGNSRLKWAWLSEDRLIGHAYLIHAEQDVSRGLAGLAAAPDRVICSSVAGSEINVRVAKAVRENFGIPAEFAKAEKDSFGLKVGYKTIENLGVDRWLAMLGAMAIKSGPLCVADAGTALTLDYVDGGGNHIGGLIAPGVNTMINSLVAGTSGISETSAQILATPFADDTGAAVQAGALYASAALIDRFVDEAAKRGHVDVPLFITGGGRAPIMRVLKTPTNEVGDLVLLGLARVARRPSEVTVEEADE